MSNEGPADIRWKQRFNNFLQAYNQLKLAVTLARQRELSELEKQGIIQSFEFTHELAWNVMKDYLDFQGGGSPVTGSRDATREAFSRGLVQNGNEWMEMIRSHNQTSHTYNRSIANEIVDKIRNEYFPLFTDFLNKMNDLFSK